MLPGEPESRPVLVSVSGQEVVEVVLEHRGRRVVGSCPVAAGRELSVAAATATLRALDALTPDTVGFRLDWCDRVGPGGQVPPAIVVLATLTVRGEARPQAGVALVHHDEQVASVRAALDAMNRRVEVLDT